jgi:hypothetical protein
VHDGHRASAGLVAGGRAPDLREHLLHHVLGVAVVAQDPPRERQDLGRVAS